MSNDFDNDFSWSDDDDNNDLPEFEEDDEFDWSDSFEVDDEIPDSGNSDNDDFDWLSDSDTDNDSPRDSGRLGVTGELSWLKSDSDDDDAGARSDEGRTGVTGELSWRESEQRASDFESMLDEAAASSGIDLFAGMDDDDFEDNAEEAQEIVEETGDDEDDEIPDWLRNVEPEEDPEEAARQSINTDELFADFDTDFEDEVQPAKPTTGELPEWIDDDSKVLDDTSPEWVKDIRSTIGTGELIEDESVELDEPDWLEDLAPELELESETSLEDESLFDDESDLEDDAQVVEEPLFDDEFDLDDDAQAVEEPLFDDEFDLDDDAQAVEEPLFDDEFDLDGDAQAVEEPLFDDESDLEDSAQAVEESLFDDEELAAEMSSELSEEAADDGLADLFDFGEDESTSEDEDGLGDLLTALEGDDDDFDLLGELDDDASDDDLLSLLEDSDEDDSDLLDQFEESADLEPEAVEEDSLEAFDFDMDFEADDNVLESEIEEGAEDDSLEAFDFGMDLGADDSLLESEEEAEEDFLDASWLDDIDSTSLDESDENADGKKVDVVTDFLSSIDDDDLGIDAPLATQEEADVDFDTLFADEAFEDIEDDEFFEDTETSSEEEPERPEWLQNVTVGEASASALVRGQQDRPIEELSDRLQALHDAGLDLGTASAALSASEAIIATDDVATSVSEENEAASILKITPEHAEKANILRNIAGVTESTVQKKTTIQQRFRTGFNFTAVSVAILIFFSVIFPFNRDFLQLGEAPAPQFPADSLQSDMFSRIQSLSAGEKVLFALEYGPTGAPELDDATSILALHVMSRNAIPVFVSTNPIGLLHGNVVINEIASNPTLLAIRDQPIVNEDFFVSRYITADNIGLRNFSDPANLQSNLSQNIDGDEIDTGIRSLDDFAYIVVISESADSVRNWSEQVGSVTDTPLLFATGFATAPLARPYVEASSGSGFIYGLRDFLTYVDQFNTTLQDGFTAPVTVQPTETPTIESTPTLEVTIEGTDQSASADTTETPATPEQAETEAQPVATATAEPTEAPTETPTEQATEQPTEIIAETATPEPTVEPTPTPTATVQEGGLFDLFGIVASNQPVNVRSGPGTSFGVVGLLQPNERVKILDENADGTWYQIELEGVEDAWIAAFLITLEINPGGSSYLPPKPFTIGRGIANISQSDTDTDTEIMTTTANDNTIPEYTIKNGELRWYGITFGLIIIVAIIIVGNLIGIIRDTNQRGK